MTTRERILTLYDNGMEPHVAAAVLGLTIDDVALTLADPSHTPTDPAGGGGGGVPNDWRSIYIFAANQPVLTTEAAIALNAERGVTTATHYTRVSFNTGNDPAPHGTAIEWDIATPYLITIGADGRYDVSVKHVFGVGAKPEEEGILEGGELLWNDGSQGPFYSYDHYSQTVKTSSERLFVDYVVPGVPFKAGDRLELIAEGRNLTTTEAVITISRIA